MAAAAVSALAGLGAAPAHQGLLLAVWCAAYLGLATTIDRRWRHFAQAAGEAA